MWPLANCVKYAVAGTKNRLLHVRRWLAYSGTHRAEPYRQCPGAEPRCRALSHWTCVIGVGGILGIRRGVGSDRKIVERFTPEVAPISEERVIDVAPPSYASRVGVREPLITGVRAIDGLLTCGVGQRMGIFASAGCGKTMLMHMLIEQTEADVFVIGLIGERGREVTEFVDMLRASHKKEKCVLVLPLPISPRSIAAMRRNWRQP